MRVLLIDFDDSFTYNIARYLHLYQLDWELVNWRNYSNPHNPTLVILGPGPGVAVHYEAFLSHLDLGRSGQNFYFGICLGHQLLGLAGGFELFQDQPVHGQSVETTIPAWPCFPVKARGQRDASSAVQLVVVEKDRSRGGVLACFPMMGSFPWVSGLYPISFTPSPWGHLGGRFFSRLP